MKNTALVLVSAIIVAVIALWLWPASELPTITEAVDYQHQSEVVSRENKQINEPQLPYQSVHGDLVRSLQGIYFDRDLAVDQNGNLRISSDLKDIFDFFFSAIEEESLDTVLARIDEYLSFKLEEPALSQAKMALADYVKYKSALYEYELAQSEKIQQMMPTTEGARAALNSEYLNFVETRLDTVKQMRNEHLGPELHQAFFEEREQYDSYMIQKLKITASDQLTAEQKQTQLAILDSQMPVDFIEKREQANPVAKLRQTVSYASQETPEKVYQARVDAVGVEAADRLTELDQQRAEWETRYEAYTAERNHILANGGLSEQDKADAVAALQKAQFNDSERVRVIALDQINM